MTIVLLISLKACFLTFRSSPESLPTTFQSTTEVYPTPTFRSTLKLSHTFGSSPETFSYFSVYIRSFLPLSGQPPKLTPSFRSTPTPLPNQYYKFVIKLLSIRLGHWYSIHFPVRLCRPLLNCGGSRITRGENKPPVASYSHTL